MNLRVTSLELVCKKSTELIPFSDFTYFYGEVGAGKSTIARLIDYCLGGSLVMTPALQSEFVSVCTRLLINDVPVELSRGRDSNVVLAAWGKDDNAQQVLLPAKKADGVVIAGTQVENLSDFIFFVAGIRPPKVRRSQLKEESDLERLSIRDLLWYCYLDQDGIDSTFFNLDPEAETFRKLKSRNVLRFILGIHQERVAELEVELKEVRRDRLRSEEAAKVLQTALEDADVSTEVEIISRIGELRSQLVSTQEAIRGVRDSLKAQRDHVTDKMRDTARQLSAELEAIEATEAQIAEAIEQDRRHFNSIQALSTKVRRIEGARAVLNGVEFQGCPRCVQALPAREPGKCSVCGQDDTETPNADDEVAATEADIAGRSKELQEVIDAQSAQMTNLRRRQRRLIESKQEVDANLNIAMTQYDSAYLSDALSLERARASLEQEVKYLEKLQALPAKVHAMHSNADNLVGREQGIRRELKEARQAAEQDMTNLKRLTTLFLDCLLRAKLPGFNDADIVSMKPPDFLPEVVGGESGDLVTTSFGTLGSGGKKTLFKCCFAIAVHRLATELDATVPSLLIIDSPMKNISERENRTQFEGFHQMLYELARNELSGTQFVLIDKEFCPPESEDGLAMVSRHMKVDDAEEPPLISYYRGK